jgi:sarcosine oxidase
MGGGSGHAFKMAPALGDCAAALALGEEPPLDLRPFAMRRLLGGDPHGAQGQGLRH